MKKLQQTTPLAARMRPKKLDEIIGQEHILGPNKLLYRAIRADRIGNIILYGPPGTGKTTIAMVIANESKANFMQLNATTSGKKDMEAAIKTAKTNLEQNQKTILFIDEIHRFNKAQQDYLLPHVESGLITLIGATTENPFFEVNKALISRCRVFELKSLSSENVKQAIKNALEKDPELANTRMDEDAITFLSAACAGDVRSALNALELAVLTTTPDENNIVKISLNIIQDCIQKKAILYDKNGDQHYDIISADRKSVV